MKTPLFFLIFLALATAPLSAVEPRPLRNSGNESLRNEIQSAISKGLAFLKAQQHADGSFRNPLTPAAEPEHPALTALPLLAFYRDPAGSAREANAALLAKGYAFLRSHVQPDGGIYLKGLSNYNTSVSLMALLNSGEPNDEPILLAARNFVASQQASGMIKPETNGGFGYGPTGSSPRRQHPDLDNTLVSLEALRTFARARPAVEVSAGKDLDWKAAIDFISRCQNLPSHNEMAWASDDPQNKGGFVYYPGFTNSETVELPGGKKALRSYGSMSYAGLLSFIYADLRKDDLRVQAALDWLGKNYTLEENPGMGRQGLYYYYHLAAKGLATAGLRELTTPEGKPIHWPRELGLKLIQLQNGDGSWVNDTARWMEKDPVLVTAYSVLTLEIIHQQL
ncbi:MAG TPA: prenyltransferase/squalene oxidase repeat-containing protein [Chthoniobacteraceae bacterium]